MSIPDELQRKLERVLWIGGPPDSGKTSVAETIAARRGLTRYQFDRNEMAHFARADREHYPALWAAHPDRMTTEERWLGSTPEEMAERTVASWGERCRMAFEELAAMPGDDPIIAEGPGFFPELIAPILSDPRKAIWLIPTEEFKRCSALARGKPGNRDETSDPERATENLIARDMLLSRTMRDQCEQLGCDFILITGEEDVDAVTDRVERRFAEWL